MEEFTQIQQYLFQETVRWHDTNMNRNFKLVSELVFAANVKTVTGNLYIADAKNLTNLSRKENVKDTIFMFLPYEKDTYISIHMLMQDERWKFLELDTPLEVTEEEIKNTIKVKEADIKDLEYLPCQVTYMMDHDHIPKEITIRLMAPSKFLAKNMLVFQKKAYYYGYFLSPNKDWKYNKDEEK